jgi:UDP-N-acetylglucosamine 1-carboxyvinyltransferase
MTDFLRIVGGPLRPGNVAVSGFKHLAVPAIASSLLLPAELTLTNVPDIEDTAVLSETLKLLGAKINQSDNQLTIDARTASDWRVPIDLSGRVHGSIYLLPALLGRFGQVEIGEAGGCRIGNGPDGQRPLLHVIEVLQRFAPNLHFDSSSMCGRSGPFHAAEIDILDWSDDPLEPNGPLVSGATKTAILAALAAEGGETVIHHPYWKPDVTGLLDMLGRAGAIVEASHRRIRMVRPRLCEPLSFELLSDLGEVMTWLACSIYTETPIRVTGITGPLRIGLKAELAALEAMGVELTWEDSAVSARACLPLHSINLEVRSHGIYSDHHPIFTLLALRADRASTIREAVWTNRFRYVAELQCLGAKLQLDGPRLCIEPCSLRPATRRLKAPDLRAAAILLLSALRIEGITELMGASELKRGYPHLVNDLQRLGAVIELMN